jgi:hypothetical protein
MAMAADPRQRESEEILRRVARDSETIGASNLARQAKGGNPEDAIDRLGRRIGRGLGLAVAIFLLAYLYVTYFRPG